VQLHGSQIRKGAVIAVAILLLCLPRAPLGIDLRMDGAGGHAVFKLGPASVRIAFDSGRLCPKSNTCRAAVETPPEGNRLARHLRGQVRGVGA